MKKNKKKKAFTLIELLAVIMILAIISLIVTVSIGRLIDNARKETYKESVRGIIRSAELYMGKYVLANHKDPVYPIVFTCDGNTCSNGADKLDFNGEVPKSGTLTLIDHKTVKAEYLSSGRYCASGTKTELQVSKSCADIDITKPTVDGTLQGNILHLTLIDNESGIASYCVATSDSTNGCSWINTNGGNLEHPLSVSGTYYVFAKDKKDNVSLGKEFITGDIEKPIVTAELDGKIIDIEVSDNASVVEYCVVSTNDSTGCTWHTVTTNSFGHTLSEAGTYYVFAKDSSGNISDSVEIIAPQTNFCAFEAGQVWENFTAGQINAWEVPCTGLYQLEVWGAQGGGNGMYSRSSSGGTGAYAMGYIVLDMDIPLYIIVGGAGGGSSYSSGGAGGYNGGGTGTSYSNNGNYDYGSSSGGGGATHISFENALIKDTQNFENILIVAGGGGGANGYRYGTDDTSTGGLSTISSNGTRSGTNGANRAGAGGGGYYGGNQRYAGTNYIDGVPEIEYKGTTYTPTTAQGQNSGNGKAKITLISY